jgi:protein-S-isoprenylcysteine O-methyltransferase Ste14
VSAATTRAERRRSTTGLAIRSLLAALWFAFWFFVAIPGLLLWLSGEDLLPRPGGSLVLGVAIIALAHLALVREVAAFVRIGRGTHAPFDPPQALLRRGPYAWVRNPMYLLYVAVVVGEALVFRSTVLVAWAASLWLLAHLFVVSVEERALRRRFGTAYAEYCARVNRWLPRPPRHEHPTRA